MVNIYLFIELLHTANAVTTVDGLKAMQMEPANSPMWWCFRTRRSWRNSTARCITPLSRRAPYPVPTNRNRFFFQAIFLCEKRALTCVSQSKIKAVAILPINPFER
jgi:hypothetical protein